MKRILLVSFLLLVIQGCSDSNQYFDICKSYVEKSFAELGNDNSAVMKDEVDRVCRAYEKSCKDNPESFDCKTMTDTFQ